MYFILQVLMSLTKTQLEGVDGGVDTLEQMGKIFYKYGFDSIFVHFSVDINKCYLLHSSINIRNNKKMCPKDTVPHLAAFYKYPYL
jgi:hypothetical protein